MGNLLLFGGASNSHVPNHGRNIRNARTRVVRKFSIDSIALL
jgi:hypothetical protein